MTKRTMLSVLLVLMLAFGSLAVHAVEDAQETVYQENLETDMEAEEINNEENGEAEMNEEADEEADEEAADEVEVDLLEEEVEEESVLIVLEIGSQTARVNGEEMELDVAAMIHEDRTMVPMAFVSRALGYEVAWDGDARTVSVEDEEGMLIMVLTIDEYEAQVHGETTPLDAPPIIVDSRTMVPVSFIGNVLGYQFEWDEVARTVTITEVEVMEETQAVEEEMEEEAAETEEEVTEEELTEEEAVEAEEDIDEEEADEEADETLTEEDETAADEA